MRVLFLNQYFPPDSAPTGVLLRELSDDLTTQGHTVDFVAAREDYRGNQRKGSRMRREMKALATMLIDGLRRKRPDVIISATSPPCLLVVATILAMRFRAKSVHWVMDLYPEIAVALGEVRPGLIARVIGKLMQRCYRRTDRVVALDADMAALLGGKGREAEIIRPWVFRSVLDQPAEDGAPEEPWTWIYSGNLGRAHEWETLLAAQALIEQRGVRARLLFQGGGPSWPAAQARARELGLAQCEWKPYVPESELRASLVRCHALVVTQLPAAQGLLWPSKLGLVMTLPRPILWVGPTNGAIARELAELPQAGIFASGEAEGVAQWITARAGGSHQISDVQVFDAAAHRAQALQRWRVLLAQL